MEGRSATSFDLSRSGRPAALPPGEEPLRDVLACLFPAGPDLLFHRWCQVIPAWLVLLSALVVIADVLAVAMFITRWERGAEASPQVEEGPGTAGRDAGWQSSAPDQADIRADALSS
jgi:hypothetical protein